MFTVSFCVLNWHLQSTTCLSCSFRVFFKMISSNLSFFRSSCDPPTCPEVSVVSSLHRRTPEVCRGWQLQVSFILVPGSAWAIVILYCHKTFCGYSSFSEDEPFLLWTLLKVLRFLKLWEYMSTLVMMQAFPQHMETWKWAWNWQGSLCRKQDVKQQATGFIFLPREFIDPVSTDDFFRQHLRSSSLKQVWLSDTARDTVDLAFYIWVGASS